MPAVSQKQQKFFGIVRAIQKGEMAPTTHETAKAAADMKKSDVKKFASTKHKGLPEKKKVQERIDYADTKQMKKFADEKKKFTKSDQRMKLVSFMIRLKKQRIDCVLVKLKS
jgi:ribosomal protein S18